MSDDKKKQIEAAIAKLDKQYGSGTIFKMDAADVPRVESFSTNAITLDRALGVGGVPRGRFTEIYGPESSGKTTVALHIIASAQKQGCTAAIIDTEHAVDLEYAARLGVDVDSLLVSQPDSGEQALDIVEVLVRAGVECIVLDSVAMLIPEAEIKGEMADLQIGQQAKLMSKAMRKLTAPVHEANCALIFINQIRDKIGGYGNPEVTPGGRALRFAASVRIDLRRAETLRDKEENVGIEIKAKVVKNKVAKPHRTALFSIYFGTGIDKEATLLDVAADKGILVKSGTWWSYNGNNIGQGAARAIEWLKAHPQEMDEIEAACA